MNVVRKEEVEHAIATHVDHDPEHQKRLNDALLLLGARNMQHGCLIIILTLVVKQVFKDYAVHATADGQT